MRKVVGISQRIKRAWLDTLLDRLVTTTDEKELRTFLDKTLKAELPGKASRAKAIGILWRIWRGIPPERLALRDRAIAMLPRISGQERIWLHWGMAALAYPFFRDTAEVIGRLLALQDDFKTAQVQGRMLTTWGDRATTKEATQKLITTLVDWEVLRSTKTKGHFLLVKKTTASIPDLQLWLLETLLTASSADEVEAQQLLRLPESFPFAIKVGVADLRKHDGFNIHRQGLDMDMVALCKVRVEQPAKSAKKAKVSDKAQARTGHDVPALIRQQESEPKDRKQRQETDRRKQPSESASKRPARLQVREINLLPDNPVGDTSAECSRQFEEGHHHACMALTQSVLEALVYHIWQVNAGQKKAQRDDFLSILNGLHRKGVIKDEWKTKLQEMWLNRHQFHHLRPSNDSDQRTLEAMARSNLYLLDELKEDFFGYDIQGKRVLPNHPEYWSLKEGEPQVLLVN